MDRKQCLSYARTGTGRNACPTQELGQAVPVLCKNWDRQECLSYARTGTGSACPMQELGQAGMPVLRKNRDRQEFCPTSSDHRVADQQAVRRPPSHYQSPEPLRHKEMSAAL